MNTCLHPFRPRTVYALPYIHAARICPLCAIELGHRLRFQPDSKQIDNAVRKMRKNLSEAAMQNFYASDDWLWHIDNCDISCMCSPDIMGSCFFGKILFLRWFGPRLQKARVA